MTNTTKALDEINQGIGHLEKSVSTFDPRFTLRVIRNLPVLRKQADPEVLLEVVNQNYDAGYAAVLTAAISPADANGSAGVPSDDKKGTTLLPEVDAFIHLLVQVWLLNLDQPDAARRLLKVSAEAIERFKNYNRRSLDYLFAKIWFYYARAAELTGTLEDVLPPLMSGLRSATLRHDDETQGMLIVLLLRALLQLNKVSQAANIVAKTTFPESASNSLAARYYYYLSRINAIQLDYSTAFNQITAAIRKVPQTEASRGFLQTANKLSILIELLMGDIPDREAFKRPEFAKSLAPYLELARAVRAGDVEQFGRTLEVHAAILKRDRNYTLSHRLRQNVIKTGIRLISLTYSKISLKDICVKLRLDGEESAEYIVAKAIRDGVIDAEINHQLGFMQSKETTDIYSTAEPQHTFHERIKFCMQLHDDSVKAMRYLDNAHREDLKDAEEARHREKELVTEIQEGTDLEDFDGDFDM